MSLQYFSLPASFHPNFTAFSGDPRFTKKRRSPPLSQGAPFVLRAISRILFPARVNTRFDRHLSSHTFCNVWDPLSRGATGTRDARVSQLMVPYLVLLPPGFTDAPSIARRAVSSYLTFSPSPHASLREAVILCGTVRPRGIWPPKPPFSWGGATHGVRTFLPTLWDPLGTIQNPRRSYPHACGNRQRSLGTQSVGRRSTLIRSVQRIGYSVQWKKSPENTSYHFGQSPISGFQ